MISVKIPARDCIYEGAIRDMREVHPSETAFVGQQYVTVEDALFIIVDEGAYNMRTLKCLGPADTVRVREFVDVEIKVVWPSSHKSSGE